MKRISQIIVATQHELLTMDKRFPSRALVFNLTTGEMRKGPSSGSASWLDMKEARTADVADVTVRVATTGNITIATALNDGDTIDGVVLATGNLVLVKSQTAPAENGIYVVGVTPARHEDFDTFADHVGVLVSVEEGTAHANQAWLYSGTTTGTLNTTGITFGRTDLSYIDRSASNNVSALDAAGALADANLLIVEQDGVMKKVALSVVKTYMTA
jgi:hypothetical protein